MVLLSIFKGIIYSIYKLFDNFYNCFFFLIQVLLSILQNKKLFLRKIKKKITIKLKDFILE